MKQNKSLRLVKWIPLAAAAAVLTSTGLHADTHESEGGLPEGLEPVLSSVSGLKIKGSFGAEFGASDTNRNRDTGTGADSYHTFNISHARLGVEATVYDDFRFDTVLSLLPSSGTGNPPINDLGGEGPGVNVYHATLSYTGFDATDLTFGYAFPRFGMEAYTNDEDLITITRSMLSTQLRPSQHTGLAAHGDWDIFDYHVGIYNGDASGGENASGTYPVGYLFNVSGGADLDEYAASLHEDLGLRLRADFIYNDEAGGFGAGGAEVYKNAFALGANLSFKDLNVAYEYMWARATDVLVGAPARPRGRGFYVMPSYFLTERFQAVARYERIRNTEGSAIGGGLSHNAYAADISGIPALGNKYQALYLGGNYYLYEDRVKLMAGLEFAELRNTDAPGIAGSNFQSRTHTAMTAVRMQF